MQRGHGAALHGLDREKQLVAANRLGQIHVGAHLHRGIEGFRRKARGNGEDPRFGAPPQDPDQVDPVDPRQREIDHVEAEIVRRPVGEQRIAVVEDADLDAVLAQMAGNLFGEFDIVFDQGKRAGDHESDPGRSGEHTEARNPQQWLRSCQHSPEAPSPERV